MVLMLIGCENHARPRQNDAMGAATFAILYIPERIFTVINLRPANLQGTYTIKLLAKDGATAATAFRIAHSDFEYDPAVRADVRWGLEVRNSNGKIIGSYYVDTWGTGGYANGRPARFKRNLRRWMREACGVCR